MDTNDNDNDNPSARSTGVPAVPETLVAGDWTVLSALAVAIAGLLLWRRRRVTRGR